MCFKRKQLKQKKEDVGPDIRFLQLFKYSDIWDKLLIVVGIFSAFMVAGIYPLNFLMYGNAAGTFVDIEKNKYNVTANTTTITWFVFAYFSFATLFDFILFMLF